MRIFDRFKKKEPLFKYDENNNEFTAEIKDVVFVCEKVRDHYEQYSIDLANSYESKLQDIIEFLLPDIRQMFGVNDISTIRNSLGKPRIDLDRLVISYLEQTLDNIHIIDVEFGGLFSEFYYVSIDG